MRYGEITTTMPLFQWRAPREDLQGVDIGDHRRDRRLFLILGAGREDAHPYASDPVFHPGALSQLGEDFCRVVHERVGEVEKPQAAARAAEALGTDRNAFAPRRRGRVGIGKHQSFFGGSEAVFMAWSAARWSSRP
jgi:hypothetical protein